MASALDGITVLDLTDGPAGALTTMFLCDHGARVIRIDDSNDITPRRDGYLVWNRSKECIRLDLSRIVAPAQRSSAGATNVSTTSADPTLAYERLLRAADVLVEDFAPSSRSQALVPFGWLSTLNPRLIHCSITAYGKHGPLKDEPPIDDLIMARLGFRPPPVHVVHPLPSVGAAILAAQGITASLLAREKAGLGRTVNTSLMAGALVYHPK